MSFVNQYIQRPSSSASSDSDINVLMLGETGTVTEVNSQAAQVLVKFEDERHLSNWIPAFQFRLPDDLEPASAEDIVKQNFHVGQCVDVVDTVYCCYTCIILQVTDAGNVK
ncbi:unnamed protein product, partial [Rotaria sp. Silwood1]